MTNLPHSSVEHTRWVLLLRVGVIASVLILLFVILIWGGGLLLVVLPLYILAAVGVVGTPKAYVLRSLRFLAGLVGGVSGFLAILMAMDLAYDTPHGFVLLLSFFAAQILILISADKIPVSVAEEQVTAAQISARPKRKRTRWGAVLGILLGVGLVLAAIIVPGLLRSRMDTNEATAVGSMRFLVTCAYSYQTSHPDIGFPREVGALGPGGDDCIDQNLVNATGRAIGKASDTRSGYKFSYLPTDLDEGVYKGFQITAQPASCGRSGIRTYFSDETGILRFTEDRQSCRPANSTSEPI